MWYHALYKPYTVTGGFLTTISEKKQTEHGLSFEIQADGRAPVVLVCLEEGKEYRFDTTGNVEKVNKGTYSIRFHGPVREQIHVEVGGGQNEKI